MRILRKRRIIATGSSSTCPEILPPPCPKRKLRRPIHQLLHRNLHPSGGQEIFGRRQKPSVPSRRREPLIPNRDPNRKEAFHHRPRLSRSLRAHRIRRMRGPRTPIPPHNPVPPRRTFNIRSSEVQDWSFSGEPCPHLFLHWCMFHGPWGGAPAFPPAVCVVLSAYIEFMNLTCDLNDSVICRPENTQSREAKTRN